MMFAFCIVAISLSGCNFYTKFNPMATYNLGYIACSTTSMIYDDQVLCLLLLFVWGSAEDIAQVKEKQIIITIVGLTAYLASFWLSFLFFISCTPLVEILVTIVHRSRAIPKIYHGVAGPSMLQVSTALHVLHLVTIVMTAFLQDTIVISLGRE